MYSRSFFVPCLGCSPTCTRSVERYARHFRRACVRKQKNAIKPSSDHHVKDVGTYIHKEEICVIYAPNIHDLVQQMFTVLEGIFFVRMVLAPTVASLWSAIRFHGTFGG